MSIQIYRDITFVFGPPSGDRYEGIKSTALRNDESFSKSFRDHMEGVFASMKEEHLLDDLFSLYFRKKINVNRIYPTYQIWAKHDGELEKFYLRPEDKFAELPALMIFPSEFTSEVGAKLDFAIDPEDAKFAEFVINPIRKAFGFDWINIFGAYADEIDFEDVLSEGEKVEFVEAANGSWASVYRYRGLYFYCDEVQNLGPFSQYSDIQEILEQLYEHVQNDKFNSILYHLKK